MQINKVHASCVDGEAAGSAEKLNTLSCLTARHPRSYSTEKSHDKLPWYTSSDIYLPYVVRTGDLVS